MTSHRSWTSDFASVSTLTFKKKIACRQQSKRCSIRSRLAASGKDVNGPLSMTFRSASAVMLTDWTSWTVIRTEQTQNKRVKTKFNLRKMSLSDKRTQMCLATKFDV